MQYRAATRGSPLALWQTRHVASLISRADPSVELVEVVVQTQGDRRLDVPIHEIGGKGVFAKEVQLAVLEGRADLAVHSGKDLPAVTPPGLVVAAVPERADPRDSLVGARLSDLPEGAVVATGSVRRRVQLAAMRPDVRFAELRGNIATRLGRVGEFDAVVVAQAALDRLGIRPDVADALPVDVMVPQVAQGALFVECREDDVELRELLARIEHPPTRRVVDAERAFLVELGGDCDLPAGAHGWIDAAGRLHLTAVLATGSPPAVYRAEVDGDGPEAGARLARELRQVAGRAP